MPTPDTRAKTGNGRRLTAAGTADASVARPGPSPGLSHNHNETVLVRG